MTTTTNQALAQQQTNPGIVLRDQHANRLASLVPGHVNGDAWVKQAVSTLRSPDLMAAATNDFGSFVTACEKAAVLGLRPGSEEFYFIPRKIKGQLRVQGIVGYQGLVDLMYRSGAVESVVVEVVHQADSFDYVPGRDARPLHRIDWDSENRGPLRLVYAYAVMRGGATSKVVVLNKADIARIKASSDGATSNYSPWVKREAAMWLKSAARQLAKWVPTSTEYIAQQAQARQVAASVVATTAPTSAAPATPGAGMALPTAGAPAAIESVPEGRVDTTSGTLLDDEGEYDPTAEADFGQAS